MIGREVSFLSLKLAINCLLEELNFKTLQPIAHEEKQKPFHYCKC